MADQSLAWRIRPRIASAEAAGNDEAPQNKQHKTHGQSAAAAPSSEATSSSGNGGALNTNQLRECVVALQKLTLQNGQALKALMAATWDCAIAPAAGEDPLPVKTALAVGSAYEKTCREKGRGHGQGPPHLHIAPAFLEELASAKELKDHNPLTAKTLLALTAFLEKMTPEEIDQMLPFFR